MSDGAVGTFGGVAWKKARGFVLPVLVIGIAGAAVLALGAEEVDLESLSYLDDAEAPAAGGPARVEPIDGSEFKRVILTERAAERLDIQTAPVGVTAGEDGQRLTIPYSALIYGLHGETWAYVSPGPLEYVRQPVVVEAIVDDMVILLDGPPVGTAVVTVGVAELYGTETGVGK